MSGRLPVADRVYSDADIAAVTACLESGWLTMGPRIKALEERLAEWAGAPHAMVVSSGTAALALALRALGVGSGDAVEVGPIGSLGPRAAARFVGADPVTTGSADVKIVTHLLGWVSPDAAGATIEDATQAIGAEFAQADPRTIRCFSLSAASQLPVGEGGIVACWDDDVAARIRSLRSHAMTSGTWDRHRGHHDSYDVVDLGYNFRLDEPRAALAATLLDRLPQAVQARREAVAALREAVAGSDWEVPGELRGDETASPAALPLLAPGRTARDLALDRIPGAVAWEESERLLLAPLTEETGPDGARRVAEQALG